VGVPKVKSAFATFVYKPIAKTIAIKIVFFILLPFQNLPCWSRERLIFLRAFYAHLLRQVLSRPETADCKPHGVSPPKSLLLLKENAIVL
jgi:hypothetical protein